MSKMKKTTRAAEESSVELAHGHALAAKQLLMMMMSKKKMQAAEELCVEL